MEMGGGGETRRPVECRATVEIPDTVDDYRVYLYAHLKAGDIIRYGFCRFVNCFVSCFSYECDVVTESGESRGRPVNNEPTWENRRLLRLYRTHRTAQSVDVPQ